MKVVVMGLGQCGGRIADEFARLNQRARSHRKIEIVTGAFAVNTDAADLSGLATIPTDYKHRILVGGRKTGGHGVGKINEMGAEIAREDSDKIIDAIRTTKHFAESDAFMLVASAAGGTGSGSLPVAARIVKERHADKPVYAIVVLPFEHEEQNEERTVYNTATCLKSVYAVADAVFLIDNQRYIKKDASLRNNMSKINALIAEPFYNVLCAGEEKKLKNIGAKTLDAGDIMQTLAGWTVIGYGKSGLPLIKLPGEQKRHFREKSTEASLGIQAMDEAISELSLTCNPRDANRAMYLLAAPAGEMNMELVKELGDYLRDVAPKAIIRSGDYPRERGLVDVTVVLSELDTVQKVTDLYCDSTTVMGEFKRKRDEITCKLRSIDDAGKDVPSLL
jgi:tubulin-like protein CetZ